MATVTAVRPVSRFGIMELDVQGGVKNFAEKPQVEGWINAGYFVFHRRFFDYLKSGDGCVLEHEPLARAAADGQLVAYRHGGFFFAMDTYREYEALNRIWNSGRRPGRSGCRLAGKHAVRVVGVVPLRALVCRHF